MAIKNGSTELINLALKGNFKSGLFQANVKATYAGKQ